MFNLTVGVIPQVLDNTSDKGASGTNFATLDQVKLDTWADLARLDKEQRQKSLTDFALLNGGAAVKTFGSYYTRSTTDGGLIVVESDNQASLVAPNDMAAGLVPSFSLDLGQLTPEQRQQLSFERQNNKKCTVKLGAFPQNKVNASLNYLLEKLYHGGAVLPPLVCTGRLYTSNAAATTDGKYLPGANPEFVYQGKRYVRSVVKKNFTQKSFNDGSPVPAVGTAQWLQVAPVSYEIRNWHKLDRTLNPQGSKHGSQVLNLTAHQIVHSGLPFYPEVKHPNSRMWQNSLVRAYLNATTTDALDGNGKYAAPVAWDFSQGGFFTEALNPEREAVREYTFPAGTTEIAAYALAGCVGLTQVVIPATVQKIGVKAFAGLNCRYAYRQVADGALVLANQLPTATLDYTDVIPLGSLTQAFSDFDYQLLLTEQLTPEVKLLASKINKYGGQFPWAIVQALQANHQLAAFVQQANFSYSQDMLPATLAQVRQLPAAEQLAFFKFATGLGCFTNTRLHDALGFPTGAVYGQKASSTLRDILKSGALNLGEFSHYFNLLPVITTPNQDFLQFIGTKEKGEFVNLNLVKALTDAKHTATQLNPLFARVMSSFSEVLAHRTDMSTGLPQELPWPEVLTNFDREISYLGVTAGDQDLAQLLTKHNLPQATFDQAVKLRHLAKQQGLKHHLLNQSLDEKATLAAQVQALCADIQQKLDACQQPLDLTYQRAFTYEMLDKYDPHNAIIGVYCSCCASLNGASYGRTIAASTMTAPDVQNLVVRDYQGQIVAKGTMYVNFAKSYAVLNDFELNHNFKHHEHRGRFCGGKYDVSPNSQDEKLRELIFEALMRGIHAFVAEYDRQFPDNPLKLVTVGMYHNRLKRQCERYAELSQRLTVPVEYGFEDAMNPDAAAQRILYDRQVVEQNMVKEAQHENDFNAN